MEVAAFHPLPLARQRLVSVALFLAFTAALAAAYSGRALPGILLYGARTFLSPSSGQRRSGWLRRQYSAGGRLPQARHSTRQRIVSPARSGTTVASPNTYSRGTVHGARASVTVPSLSGRP